MCKSGHTGISEKLTVEFFFSNLEYVHVRTHHFEYILGDGYWWQKTLRKGASIGPIQKVYAAMSQLRDEKGLRLNKHKVRFSSIFCSQSEFHSVHYPYLTAR